MISNMGTTDRVVRFLIALGLAVLYFTDTVSGITAVAFGIVAVLFRSRAWSAGAQPTCRFTSQRARRSAAGRRLPDVHSRLRGAERSVILPPP